MIQPPQSRDQPSPSLKTKNPVLAWRQAAEFTGMIIQGHQGVERARARVLAMALALLPWCYSIYSRSSTRTIQSDAFRRVD